MLRIKTVLGPSKIHGIGLFADQFIPKDTITWQYDDGLDPSFPYAKINELPEIHRSVFLKYGYLDKQLNIYIICNDDQRFINHSSSNFNITSQPDHDVALRDIHPGEELLCNYRHYESDWFETRDLKETDFNDL